MRKNRISRNEQSLLTALAGGRELYGVQLQEQAPHMSFGKIYTCMDRLEEAGLVTSRMGEATAERGGRPKKYFEITESGLAVLRGEDL